MEKACGFYNKMEEPFSTQPKYRHGRRDSIHLPPFMDLQTKKCKCPICLDVLTDPVTTPCGHNFCKSCLKECWDNSQDYKCLHCKERFSQRPDLKSNTVLREIVQLCEKNTTAQLCINSPLSEELQCSVCLDVFSDPVTIPCGHNFCKTCLELFWSKSQKCLCPFCKETFNKCPDLKCNTALGEIVQLFEKNTGYKREPVTTEYSQSLEFDDQEETLSKPSAMASSSSVLTENLECLICLELSTDPMMTPCGHIFCKACLKECWEISHDSTCPCCKEDFTKRVDVTHREHLLPQSEILMWRSSYLEPHEHVLNVKQVTMLDFAVDINPKTIQKHNRALEMFCGKDQTSVIQSCSEGDHKTHSTVLVEDETKEKKGQEIKMHKLVQQIIQDMIDQKIKNSEMEKSKELKILKPLQQMIQDTMKKDQKNKNKEKEEADNIKLCTDLNYSTEKYQEDADLIGLCTDLNYTIEKCQTQKLKILKLVREMIQDTVNMDQKTGKPVPTALQELEAHLLLSQVSSPNLH
ncbi:E3 ubiquitin/ISG15 ligase TRIM25 isoform X2 [Puntigrus tetrazona]|uniref:E3 ubiquitin/ISG15 ligase TRIM25 isoform X2 n=1 Tax=Puntigrus tetrazona TaxID=1606681 RepID=UPI001C890D8E|nr:E3 ubiquitin/ISG15 ligase TRIM25 isoform X2 [Puntigrus tetrazona]